MFAGIARTVIAHPWRTIVVWQGAAGLVIALSPSLSTYTSSNQRSFLRRPRLNQPTTNRRDPLPLLQGHLGPPRQLPRIARTPRAPVA